MEEVCELLSGKHVSLFSNNQPTVHWVQQLAAKISVVAGQMIQVLALRLKIKGFLPLTPIHVAGAENVMSDTPSCSFGNEPKLHFAKTTLMFCICSIQTLL